MSYSATVIEVLIASPSDVVGERSIARDVILKWNQINAKKEGLILIPRMWELDATPQMGGDPQDLINKQIVNDSDFIIAVFWTRVGSPTPRADSGTIEEITQHIELGKPTLIYFSRKPLGYEMAVDQREALKVFEAKIKSNGLRGEFRSDAEFKERLRDDLERTVHRVLDGIRSAIESHSAQDVSLSDKAMQILSGTAKSAPFQFVKRRMGFSVQIWAGKTIFTQGADTRAVIGWNSAIQELLANSFCRSLNDKDEIFELTEDGFNYLKRAAEQRFKTDSDIYVETTIRRTIVGEEPSGGQLFNHVIRLPKSVVEDAGIEWDYRFILQDQGFKNLVLSKVASQDTDRILQDVRSSTWKLEKVKFYEGDHGSLGQDYEQLGDACLLWNI